MAGTSAWQPIGYCVDVMMKISPASILDVGCGYGRWGMLAREFCDVWRKRYFPRDWTTRVVAIEAFAENIQDYHHTFYNEIHIGEAAQLLVPGFCRGFDLVILGDVLEHLERAVAERVLDRCVGEASYVLVNIPLGAGWAQDELYGNEFERHRSVWRIEDFRREELCHYRLFAGCEGGVLGSFVFSGADPRGVRAGLYSCYEGPADDSQTRDALADAVSSLKAELASIHGSRAWRMLDRIRTSLPWRAARRVLGRGRAR